MPSTPKAKKGAKVDLHMLDGKAYDDALKKRESMSCFGKEVGGMGWGGISHAKHGSRTSGFFYFHGNLHFTCYLVTLNIHPINYVETYPIMVLDYQGNV